MGLPPLPDGQICSYVSLGLQKLVESCLGAEEPAKAVLAGDSPVDVETGRRAGMLTVAVTHGLCAREGPEEARPDRLVEGIRELLDLARENGW